MSKLKKIFTSVRVLILIAALVLALVAIQPRPWNDGVSIRTVISNSSANIAGIQNPKPGTQPVSIERIIAINNKPIHTI